MSGYDKNSRFPGRKLLYFIFAVGVVTVLSIAVFMADLQENSGELCSSCHTMRPEYHTWKASSHSSLGCIECHQQPGAKGRLLLMADLARMAESMVLKNYVVPIRMFRSVDDDNCLSCHAFKKEYSVTGDLIIPHEDHTNSKVRCVSCHSGVAHGDIAHRGVTKKVAFSDWDEDLGLQQMARELSTPRMDSCMSCHYRRRITTECAACHTDMYGPDNHKLDDFAVNHGVLAKTELNDCNTCHGYVGPEKLVIKDETDLVDYTRRNTFCVSCHKKEPPTHQVSDFMANHGRVIKEGQKEKEACLVCHDNNLSDKHVPVAALTCSSCHPARHRKNFREGHLPFIAPGEKLSAGCMICHSDTQCLSCHQIPGYGSSGGYQLPSYNPDELPTDFFM